MSKEAVLIHGWDPAKYNNKFSETPPEDIAWDHRKELVTELGQHFDVEFYNLPGFAGQPEPSESSFDVENFTDQFASWIETQERVPQVVIGYSFGGAVALDYKARYKPETLVVLVAPALKRAETIRSGLAHTVKQLIPSILLVTLKDLYQRVASQYYREGTPFLQATYDKIVRRDMTELLGKTDVSSTLLIYGTEDDTTPWELVKASVKKNGIPYHLILGGGHNIGQTNPKEIVEAILNFTNKKRITKPWRQDKPSSILELTFKIHGA